VIERAIALPFSFNSAGELSYTNDEKKIIQDRLVLAIMTRPGERVMQFMRHYLKMKILP